MNLSAYHACNDGAAFYKSAAGGCLRISGPDRTAFIQRQTTNDIHLIGANTGLVSVLTSPNARILQVFYLVEEKSAQGLLAFCLGGQTSETAAFLKRRIFFMDQVTVEEESFAVLELCGPKISEVMNQLGLSGPVEPNQINRLTFQGQDLLAMKPAPTIGLGLHLALPASKWEALASWLAVKEAIECDRETYECVRIEAGIAGEGEFIEDFTPLEIGLGEAISASKGCYTGQEVIARQVTYDRVTQALCKLQFSMAMRPGTGLTVDGRPAGTITSVTQSPREGWIGLGVVKRPYFEPGSELSFGEGQARVLR